MANSRSRVGVMSREPRVAGVATRVGVATSIPGQPDSGASAGDIAATVVGTLLAVVLAITSTAGAVAKSAGGLAGSVLGIAIAEGEAHNKLIAQMRKARNAAGSLSQFLAELPATERASTKTYRVMSKQRADWPSLKALARFGGFTMCRNKARRPNPKSSGQAITSRRQGTRAFSAYRDLRW
jgi:hypothetical protein